MAPFGKNFLKARLKNRTNDAEPAVGKEIQVTVGNEEKVVCGVTKHTTCADLIQALLEDHRSVPESRRLLHGEPKDFCLVERWKGFERALPPLTRILRLWLAWGDQRSSIQFVLVKTGDLAPQPARKAPKAKGARPKRWEHGRPQQQQQQQPQPLPAERQKRLVKKAFRKLEKLHSESRSPPGAQEVESMVQLILSQDHAIREQIRHMGDLDAEIERLERREAEAEAAAASGGGGEEQLEELLLTSDGVQRLELQVHRHQELILQLSRDIDAELRGGGAEEGATAAAEAAPFATASPFAPATDQSAGAAELRGVRAELQRSLFAGVALHAQAAEADEQLRCFDAAVVSMERECWQLAAQLGALQVDGGVVVAGDEEDGSACPPPPAMGEAQAARLKHAGLSPVDITDTDSDTGISSTHSQDSLSPCLDFLPPLDTDV